MINSTPGNEPAQPLLRLSKIADLLGVKAVTLHSVRKYIEAFPAPKNSKGILLFCPEEVQAWAADRDVKAAMREAARNRQKSLLAVDNTEALLFIAQRTGDTKPKARRVYNNLRYDC
ncbi:MAG: hypothetical protein Q7U98_20250 [Methylicorpusculum sp.]|uniref:helix-turn-helix transcriptional regulator n=1 Tax=Methylicorpusculum sp. TaxID=2713644 RepID=UPI00272265E6|nr:hypothetical protein [Methylicorpusculum sp.]MDO8941497.1 hypothetical protein [Methylicorpusculum sp.]MDP2202277.1 hypothetical protein [Methylicorpusculum sp.]